MAAPNEDSRCERAKALLSRGVPQLQVTSLTPTRSRRVIKSRLDVTYIIDNPQQDHMDFLLGARWCLVE